MIKNELLLAYKLQSDESSIFEILKNYKLKHFYEFLSNNQSNNLPYHNFYHAKCMLLNCFEGIWHESFNDKDEHINTPQIRGLLVGALYHDFGHSGGYLSDSENISIALEGLDDGQIYAESNYSELSKESLLIAKSVIEITQYPYIKEPQTIFEKIIRDADLMQFYEEDSRKILIQYLGLKREVEIQLDKTFTIQEWANGCKQFQDNSIWYTKWAQDIKDLYAETAKNKLFKLLVESDNLLMVL